MNGQRGTSSIQHHQAQSSRYHPKLTHPLASRQAIQFHPTSRVATHHPLHHLQQPCNSFREELRTKPCRLDALRLAEIRIHTPNPGLIVKIIPRDGTRGTFIDRFEILNLKLLKQSQPRHFWLLVRTRPSPISFEVNAQPWARIPGEISFHTFLLTKTDADILSYSTCSTSHLIEKSSRTVRVHPEARFPPDNFPENMPFCRHCGQRPPAKGVTIHLRACLAHVMVPFSPYRLRKQLAVLFAQAFVS